MDGQEEETTPNSLLEQLKKKKTALSKVERADAVTIFPLRYVDSEWKSCVQFRHKH